MTLDEAIKHCEEKSQGCDKCSEDHKQLADWLKELKSLKQVSNLQTLNNTSEWIKFRGIGWNGHMYTGDLVHFSTGIAIKPHIDCEDYEEIRPESVSQFIGYDCDGKEVYHGDVGVNREGAEFVWEIRPQVFGRYDLVNVNHLLGNKFPTLKLKE